MNVDSARSDRVATKQLLSDVERILGELARADQSDEMEAVRENHRRTWDMLRRIAADYRQG